MINYYDDLNFSFPLFIMILHLNNYFKIQNKCFKYRLNLIITKILLTK